MGDGADGTTVVSSRTPFVVASVTTVGGDTLVVTVCGGVLEMPIGAGSGMASTIEMWSERILPTWWGGYPTRLAELRILDAAGEILARLPAGAGWFETARPSFRGLLITPSSERNKRLVPVWSRGDLALLCGAIGLTVTEVKASGTRWVSTLDDPYALSPATG
jgi:hypothetical protein